MLLEISEGQIRSFDLSSFYKIVGLNDGEFYEKAGDQHYRLLAYLSTLFNHSSIIDFGTSSGYSALALSYNLTNRVHSFLPNMPVNQMIREKENIRFYTEIDPLSEKFLTNPSSSTNQRWEQLIKDSSIIFLDRDPHNGSTEWSFYQYLVSINYSGFLLCDDIWYFKEMRDRFWYQVPDSFTKLDLTYSGHWSGTGLITCLPDIKAILLTEKPRKTLTDWTLVTAFFNLTKCPDASDQIRARNPKFYMNNALSSMGLPYNLVVYCDPESEPLLRKLRPSYLQTRTHWVIIEFDEIILKSRPEKTFKELRKQIKMNRLKYPYNFDPRNTPSYYLFCMSRYMMLQETIDRNYFNSTHFAWYNVDMERMGFKNLIALEETLELHRNRFSTCYIDYLPKDLVNNMSEFYKWGRCTMCSGFFTGNATYMKLVCELIERQFFKCLDAGYGHADEQLYSPVYFDHPELFEQYFGDYQQMITNYRYVREKPESIIGIFIQQAALYQNYTLVNKACQEVWESHLNNLIKLNPQDQKRLLKYWEIARSSINK